ncbi:MAG: 16S rRNA (guanine(966)-N(2))-methyltransferase RsmD [Candidatus Izemoplasmatales bacterium]|nr:16S rRNA (guanine(966)-N(2))-methyltransferase RsmD [Candidatus Izemoplasmatales bacterium]
MLRVISGKFKSRKLKEVKTDSTRPTTDKNKEMLFNVIGQYFDGDFVVDLFSGSGALGIEALSRGAGYVEFVDNNFSAIKVIKENLGSFNLLSKDETKVYKSDVLSYLQNTAFHFDIILADPPYKYEFYEDILNIIASRQLLNDDGIIVLESDKDRVLPEKISNLVKKKEKVTGITKFTIYEKGE